MKLRLRSQGQPELPRVSLFLRATLRALTVVGLPILVLAPFAGKGGAAPHQEPGPRVISAPARPSKLLAGSTLRGGESLVSANGRYRLAMQTNGNLVLTSEGHVLWASQTGGHPGAAATMQRDGNFVIYQRRRAIWNSETSRRGKQGYYLLLQPEGSVVVYSPAGRAIWRTNTPTAVAARAASSAPRPTSRPDRAADRAAPIA